MASISPKSDKQWFRRIEARPLPDLLKMGVRELPVCITRGGGVLEKLVSIGLQGCRAQTAAEGTQGFDDYSEATPETVEVINSRLSVWFVEFR